MKKVRRILTIKDWIKRLHYILHNFFFTDLLMYKQGVIYEKESYQKKMRKRFKRLFYKLEKIIEKEGIHLEQCRKEKRPKYSPERVVFVAISETDNRICTKIKEMLAGEPYARKNLKEFLEIEYYLNEKTNEDLRKEYRDYVYIPRKEKVVKYLKIK